jgi:hypothetical protein
MIMQRFQSIFVPMAACVLLGLAGCAGNPLLDSAEGKRLYLVAKNACIARYPREMAAQSDCRARAADSYIRPYYRYGDLMTRAQTQRRALAERADRREISTRDYERLVARSDAAISREEDQRNAKARESVPLTGLSGPLADPYE